jgi:hypothetical protein
MEDAQLEMLARTAGLDAAWKSFAEDVRAAARRAAAFRKDLAPAIDPYEEPWPPMRVELRP